MTDPNLLYRIRPCHPGAHLYAVDLTIPNPDPSGQIFSFPAWLPGSYMIRDFAKHIVTLEAHAQGRALALIQLDKQSWRAPPCSAPLELHLEIYAWDLSVRGAHLDTTHGYFNGSSLLPRVHGRDQEPLWVEILAPEGDGYWEWQVATTLTPAGAEPWGFGRYRADDYEDLIDHPVEMGTFSLIEFEAAGVPHAVAISGRHTTDGERLAADLKQLCEYQIGLFGGRAPFDRYLFQIMVVGDGYGGLEHRRSTSLLVSRGDLPRPGEEKVSESYRSLLGLCSHEYFHSWNVKRIRPAVFIPYDLSQEVHTPLLWVFEGFTAYYDDLCLVRSGLIEATSYLELLGRTISRVLRGSGRHKQSVAASSFNAWTKFYKADENAPNAIVSYYTKGSLLALALDLEIRSESDGERSLDDVMRALWRAHGENGVGVTERNLRELLERVAGYELGTFFGRFVHGTDDPPLAELLEPFGITLQLRPAESPSDKGGKRASASASELAERAHLGLRSGDDPLGAKVLNVFDEGAAQAAGIAAGDVLVALDGLRISHTNLEQRLAHHRPGDSVAVHLFRRDELLALTTTLLAPPVDTCWLELDGTADERAVAARASWLGLAPPATATP